MDPDQIVERFIYRTGASKEIAIKYLERCDGVLNTAVILYRADKNEGKVA
ncbi:hypothetical protein MXL54_14890 [Enterobacteriaceae bacterium G50]|nr:hypothetical protein [Enterobacteriaceae bacterium G50]